jgi:hypothetical protein
MSRTEQQPEDTREFATRVAALYDAAARALVAIERDPRPHVREIARHQHMRRLRAELILFSHHLRSQEPDLAAQAWTLQLPLFPDATAARHSHAPDDHHHP